jgi:hypothetical protein
VSDPESDLRAELTLLRTAMARRFRERLESKDPLTPAWMEAVRKFLTDQGMVLGPEAVVKAPPITQGLPFPLEP